MLYDKSAIEKRTRITPQMLRLAKEHDPCRLPEETIKILKDGFHTGSKRLKNIKNIVNALNFVIGYDYQHSFEGIRNAEQVLKMQRGHCIELNVLLMTSLKALKIDASWLVTKNPVGYDGAGVDSIYKETYGVHPFVVFEQSGKKYRADVVASKVTEAINWKPSLVEVYLSSREFTAFWMMDGAIVVSPANLSARLSTTNSSIVSPLKRMRV